MTNGRLVVDASIVAKAYLKDEAFSDIAAALLGDFAHGTVELFAPQVLLCEIPSALEKAVRRGRISAHDADQAISQFFDLGIVTVGDTNTLPELISSAYRVARRLGGRIYDALYLIVAEGLHIPFITADRKLYTVASDEVTNLIWIEDYAQQLETPP
jgi:predicted nucleic acid-binding protein